MNYNPKSWPSCELVIGSPNPTVRWHGRGNTESILMIGKVTDGHYYLVAKDDTEENPYHLFMGPMNCMTELPICIVAVGDDDVKVVHYTHGRNEYPILCLSKKILMENNKTHYPAFEKGEAKVEFGAQSFDMINPMAHAAYNCQKNVEQVVANTG